MNRGSAAQLYWYDTARLGFNEAPIHESGKFRDQPAVVAQVVASMRPRFMNRGSDR